MREALNSTDVIEFLFSKVLVEKVKGAKVLEAASKMFKSKTSQKQSSDSKNWNGPPRRSTFKKKKSLSKIG